eukprot:7048749-Prymnesium_polylepis.2
MASGTTPRTPPGMQLRPEVARPRRSDVKEASRFPVNRTAFACKPPCIHFEQQQARDGHSAAPHA